MNTPQASSLDRGAASTEPKSAEHAAPRATRPVTVLMAVGFLMFLWGAYFLNYCDRQSIYAIFPALKVELRLTDVQLGLIGAVFGWVYGAACLIAGQFADRLSKRALITASLSVWSAITLATGLAGSALQIIAIRASMAIAEAFYMPAAISLTASVFSPAKRSRAIAFLSTAQLVATVVGTTFAGWMAQQGRWREVFFVLGGLGLMYAIPLHLFLRSIDENTETETVKADVKVSALALIRVPTYMLLCGAFALFGFGLTLIYSWLPTYLHEKFSLNLGEAAFTSSVYLQSATLVGMIGGGYLADWLFARTRSGRYLVIIGSMVVCAPCLHALGNSPTLALTCWSAAAYGFSAGFLMVNLFPAAFEVVPANTRASAVGMVNFTASLVGGFAPLLGGMWKSSVGLDQLLSYTGVAYLVGAGALGIGVKHMFARDYAKVHPPAGT